MTRRLAEVAKKVGVSEATVSRVLNGKPGVSDATRQTVLTALDVLGYERPVKLRGERARLVGLVLPELQNPIFPAFAEVIGVALAQRGYTPVLCTQTAGGISEADYVDLLLQQQVSGVVFAGGLYAQRDAPHGHYARLRERRPPHRARQRRRSSGLGFPCVACDDAVADRAGDGPPPLARPRAHRRARGTARPRALEPQARRRAARSRPAPASSCRTRSSPGRWYSLEAAQAAAVRLLRRRRDGHRVRQRPHGAGCDPRRAPRGSRRARRRLDRGLRRLVADELHRAAADHGAPADRGDGPHGHRAAARPRWTGDAGAPSTSSAVRARARGPRARPDPSAAPPSPARRAARASCDWLVKFLRTSSSS